uniref:HDC02165 n=1 Tax=Drosophila melanogaster TaxID=7227 RepID=Q6IHM5_DROME|nr:TPA_inf: HDC02165 [Drosophila melanogaster]
MMKMPAAVENQPVGARTMLGSLIKFIFKFLVLRLGPASTIPLTHTGIPQKEEPGHRVLSLLLLLLLLSLWQSPPVAAPSVIVAMEMNINAGRILAVDSAEHRESRIVDRGLRSAEER